MEKRRERLRRHAVALRGLALALGGALAAGGHAACELPPGKRLGSERLALSYRTIPAKIDSGRHFEVYFGFCPNVPGPIKVDAHMPEHRHGMNYRPTVSPAGGGYRSEGWLFHMPGRWEFVFEVGGERFTDSVRIE